MPIHQHIDALFHPKNIAIIGASATLGKVGNIVLQNLIQGKFSGAILPVNPRGGSILGIPAFASIADIPLEHRPLDLAVLCVPAEKTLAILHELGKISTKSVLILAAGFKETGGQGAILEEHVKDIARHYQMALLGPNSLGLVYPASDVNLTFAADIPSPGNIGFFSQSGALYLALFDWAKQQNIGFSAFVSLGNKAIIDESDLLAYLADDPNTKVIAGYLESVENGQRFLHNAHTATRKKPVILLKAGRTHGGARAASSHTGALVGSDMAFEAAFKQTGIIRANKMEDLFGMAHAFASQPLPKGSSVAIVTNAGGPGIVTADACEAAGLTLARFTPETLAKLKHFLPPYASPFNPVDVIGDATAEHIADAAKAAVSDPQVHALLLLATTTGQASVEDVATLVCQRLENCDKPVLACFMGGENTKNGQNILHAHGIPCYTFPEAAVEALASMYAQSQWKDNPLPVEVNYRCDISKARKIIDTARAEGVLELVEFQALDLLRAYEMPILEAKLARTSDEAVQIAKQLGGKVALKIASPQITHKTDVQGVALGLDTPEAIRAAFLDITGRAAKICQDAYIAGCLVQAMAPDNAREVIIGFKRDEKFGPIVFFGLAGIHSEAFKDISSRLAPLSLDDVYAMVREVKAFPILAGMHGQLPVKFTAIEDILLIMSQLALDFPEIQEAECNPVLVNEHKAFIADIRVLLRRDEKRFLAPKDSSSQPAATGQTPGTAQPKDQDV